jgi:3-hydroxybutyryl-CoA dehydrogenase
MKTVCVVGAGTMGSGIAQVCAQAGLDVRLQDVSAAALDRARQTITQSLERLMAKGDLSSAQRDAAIARIEPSTSFDAVGDADVAIEAIIEDPPAKTALFARLDARMAPGAMLASNTSSISITALAAATRRPDRVVGLHFMNPVPVMTLVELVRGRTTSEATMAEARAFCATIGKTPVEAADAPGFIANRVLMPMINEAVFALMEGVGTADAIDTVMTRGMNHPMGPLRLADLIGLDVCLAILEVLRAGLGEVKYRPCPLLRRMVEAGQLGRKTGRGFYEYS